MKRKPYKLPVPVRRRLNTLIEARNFMREWPRAWKRCLDSINVRPGTKPNETAVTMDASAINEVVGRYMRKFENLKLWKEQG
jgi:hypothetical protein